MQKIHLIGMLAGAAVALAAYGATRSLAVVRAGGRA